MQRHKIMAVEIDIDVELLIKLVKERPVLWDKSNGLYKDRNHCKRAWSDICLNIKKDYHSFEELEKREIARYIIAKWNNLRDNWMKSYKKIKLEKRTAGGRKSRKYIYYHQLQFLERVVDKHILSTSNTRKSVLMPTINSNTNVLSTKRDKLLMQQRSRRAAFESKILDALGQKNEEQRNHHQLFFESIMPSVSKFDEDETLEFRIEVLNLIRNIKERSASNGNLLEDNDGNCDMVFHKQEVLSPPSCDAMDNDEYI